MTEATYRVLARKYRPASFAELIGQDAMVRTLANAVAQKRIAHAFVLTGVRGVGKTTTARIIARGLNCTGPDAKDGPTMNACGVCENCRAIGEDRHPDVIEMDAASRTGIDDIRELIDGVRYLPTMARTKVYIVDEVHMLSDKAFNALLKTLEEPPPQVVFIFATTEIRKVPVTVLSRCQRFDLRRIETEAMIAHLSSVATKEAVEAETGALALIARAAEGSVRDALSLLDQAIAHGGGKVAEAAVRDMLGLADRLRVHALFETVMKGDIAKALGELRAQYDLGVDPTVVLQDLLDLSHLITRFKVAAQGVDQTALGPDERASAKRLAETLSVPTLTRAWQMLLKGLREAREAPSPIAAAEMALIRLAFAADLPNPADLVRRLQDGGNAPAAPRPSPAPMPTPGIGPVRATAVPPPEARSPRSTEATALAPEFRPSATSSGPAIRSFAELVAMAEAKNEMILHANLIANVRPVRFEPPRFEFRPTEKAPRHLAGEIKEKLSAWTGTAWSVAVSREEGEPTIAERRNAAKDRAHAGALEDPLVARALQLFPGAELRDVRDIAVDESAPAEAATGEDDA
jgi:DNA polymerase-3 subunit gamma/tau